MMLDVTDLDIVARTVMAEAEGEKYKGKLAVAAVIYNRVRNPGWWGRTVKGVCLAPMQFSSWNDDDPRRKAISEWRLVQNRMFRDSFRAAIEAFDTDPTNGANSFYAHDQVNPYWAIDHPGKIIGKHTFIRV